MSELNAKRDRLLELIRGYGTCAVAFSGGIDSTVVAKAAQLALGDSAVAVTGTSASLAAGELEEARSSPPTNLRIPTICATTRTAATIARPNCTRKSTAWPSGST